MSAELPSKVRAFVALELDERLRARLGDVVASLQREVPGVRWVRMEGMHLTLRFLGWCSPEALAAIEPGLRRAAGACPRAEARVSGLGLFPDGGRPRVLWIGIALPEPILELQLACEEAAVASGFAPEPRPFRSHLTLGRFREGARRPSLPAVDLGHAFLDTLVLYRSQPQRQGAVYTPLVTFPLGEAARSTRGGLT